MKPLAERIDSFTPRKQVIYRCFACNTSFAILGDKIKYCFNCGEIVDWNGVEVLLPDSLESIWMNGGSVTSLDEFERPYIDELNVNYPSLK